MPTYIPNNQLRPCERCNGPLGPCFHVITERLAVVDPERANQHLGLVQMFGGRPGAEGIANALGSGAVYRLDEASITHFVCQGCHT